MSRWSSDSISELCKINKGQQVNKITLFDSGEYYVLNGGIEPSGYLNKCNKRADTISISEGGNSCGFVKFNTVDFWSGGHCYTLEALKNCINKKYFYHFLKFNEENIMALRVGSGLPNIQKKELSNFNVQFPENINEQEKIAEILSEVDRVIDITRKLINKYKHLKEGLLQDLLTNGIDENGNIRSPKTHEFKDSPLGLIPVEWECVCLNDFVGISRDAIVAGPFGSDLKVSDYCDEGIPLIRLQNVGSDIFIDKDIMYISKKKATELKRHSFKVGDIVLAKLGIPIGKTAIVPVSFSNGIVVADVVRISENPRIYNKYFLMFMLNSEIGRRQLNAELIGTTRPRVNISQLKKIFVKQPKLSEQNEIGSQVLELDNKIRSEELYASKLQSVKKGLMQDLLNQKVSVNCLI